MILSEELIQKGISAAVSAVSLIPSETTALVNEVLNWMLFEAALTAVSTLVGMVVFFKFFKLVLACWTAQDIDEELELKSRIEKYKKLVEPIKETTTRAYYLSQVDRDTERLATLKTNTAIRKLIPWAGLFFYFFCVGESHIISPTAKILIAPKLALIENGASLLQKVKNSANKR